jgi:hypothetical protein
VLKKRRRKISETQSDPTTLETLAILARLDFYRKAQFQLDEILKSNPSLVGMYLAHHAAIDTLMVKWDVRLEALADGDPPIDPPTEVEVKALQSSVAALHAVIAQALAFDTLMQTVAEVADQWGDQPA